MSCGMNKKHFMVVEADITHSESKDNKQNLTSVCIKSKKCIENKIIYVTQGRIQGVGKEACAPPPPI